LFQRIEDAASALYRQALPKFKGTSMAGTRRKPGIDEDEEAVGSRHLFISLVVGLVLIVVGMIAVFTFVH